MSAGAHTQALVNVAKICMFSCFVFGLLLFMYFVLHDAQVMNVLIRSTLKILFVHPNLYLKYTPHLSLCASSGASILMAGLASLV